MVFFNLFESTSLSSHRFQRRLNLHLPRPYETGMLKDNADAVRSKAKVLCEAGTMADTVTPFFSDPFCMEPSLLELRLSTRRG